MPGKYVVAVSGGVDSMALLHLLRNQPGIILTVAHLDHGIREDSSEDRKLVQTVARQYGLPFVFHEARLGAGASEATARKVRYDFLHKVRRSSGANALITAHHQDDVLETAIINLIRGTGRKGLTSLGSRHDVVRPLLRHPKTALLAYAREHGLNWREDSTNQNTHYLRNYIRVHIVPRLDEAARQRLLTLTGRLREINREIDTSLVNYLHVQDKEAQLNRRQFNQLPHALARETMAAWLRANGLSGFDRRLLERLVIAAKVSPAGKQFDVLQGCRLAVGVANLALLPRER